MAVDDPPSTMELEPFTPVPTEIMRLILAFAALLDTKTAVSISLLSLPLREFILPYLVRTVILLSNARVRAFISFLTLRPEVAIHVENLCIITFDPNDVCRPIFNACTRVKRCALQHTFLRYRLDSWHSLNSFSCEELSIFGPTFPHDWEMLTTTDMEEADFPPKLPMLMRNLKTLCLFDTLSGPKQSGPMLALTPLTHLALPFHEHIDKTDLFRDLAHIVQSKTLKMIVLLISYRMLTKTSARTSVDAWARSAREYNDKLYVVFSDTNESDLMEWRRSIDGREDIWERARRERAQRDAKVEKEARAMRRRMARLALDEGKKRKISCDS